MIPFLLRRILSALGTKRPAGKSLFQSLSGEYPTSSQSAQNVLRDPSETLVAKFAVMHNAVFPVTAW
jgi:hypothetical protein